ncbi:hypothetical protein [Brachyspira catarrhinii]|uniref:DUF4304 domain-containing protein n=1 Tax=Brachyspira catarrhinii TaxID=2528966 RepID=A0ABY2TU13_9SPIR|nr:hypothetical protein [Brachyspira catarrhinii]TKZ35963.1 hypothetical protein EZH24_02595 [Brachyspira catarrhinii]
MEDKNIHSKIIKQVCKEILIPLGVFQKGTSRLYLDDNDYFFTVVEFQPSNWDRGTYLNIGLTFLWDYNQSDVLYFEFSRQPASRYGKFVEYKNEIQFKKEIINLVNIAKEEILFYRKLRDIEFAKDWMISYIEKFNEKKYAKFGLDIANICILNKNMELAKFYYENYHRELNTEEQMNYKNLSEEYLNSNIKTTRKMWHSKSSMKKMPISIIYDS